MTSRDKEKADRNSREEDRPASPRTDPKAARYRKCSPAGRQGSSPPEAPMASMKKDAASAPQQASYKIQKREGYRDWMVIDPQGELVCLTVYKRGAVEVVRRLAG
jgi:hypothetical protein